MKANFLDVTSLETRWRVTTKPGFKPIVRVLSRNVRVVFDRYRAVKLPRYVPHDEYDDNPIDLRDLNNVEGGFEMYDQDEDDEEMEE